MDTEEDALACEACSDTGWQTQHCLGVDQQAICGRRRRHYPHSFAVPCPCRPINRNYQDRLVTQRRVA